MTGMNWYILGHPLPERGKIDSRKSERRALSFFLDARARLHVRTGRPELP
jgi:hypothetical protein